MLLALVGGALIGLAATLFWYGNGRVAGISGILSGALRARGQRADLILFLIGLVAAGVLFAAFRAPPPPSDQPLGALLVAGVLVGFGTKVGSGCTSGHGVCGLARLSSRSLVATLTFMAAGAATIFVLGHLLPGVVVR
jgi:uncharacterized membrane protein YedE/YeeE